MDLVSIEIRNFFTVGDGGISIPLNVKDLVLISGINKDYAGADSNGAGKSLIFEAIVWALWGLTVRKQVGDEVVNDKTKKNCRVSLNLREGKDLYTVTRYQKSNEAEKVNDLILLKNGEAVVAHSKAATQQRIDSIVGMDFVTCCAMMPGAKLVAASMTDASIKELLEKILHTGDLPKALAITREKLREQRAEKHALLLREQSLSQEIEDSTERVKDYNKRHKGFKVQNEQQIAAYMEKLSTIRTSVENKRAEIVELEKQLVDFQERRNTLASAEKRVQNCRTMRKAAEGHVETARRTGTGLQAVASSDVKRCLKALRDLEGLKGACRECQQTIDAAHVERLKVKLLAEYDQAVDKQKEVVQECKVEVEAQQQQLDQWYKYEKTALEAQQKANKLVKQDVDNAQLKKTLEGSLQTWEKDQEFLEDQINKLEKADSGFEELRRKELVVLVAKKAERLQVVADQSKYDKEIERLEFWEKAFAPTGIRSYVLEQVTPVLNERAQHYCNLLSAGEMKIEFTTKTQQKKKAVDKFQIKTSFKHGAKSWKGVSEGEKARANLVIALALGDLAAYRSHKKLKFRFLDEVFSHVDETGSDVIIKLLKDQKQQYGTVFVVTHSPRIQAQFKKKILVTKENAFSTVEVNV